MRDPFGAAGTEGPRRNSCTVWRLQTVATRRHRRACEFSLAIRHSSYFCVILYAALWTFPALRQRVQT